MLYSQAGGGTYVPPKPQPTPSATPAVNPTFQPAPPPPNPTLQIPGSTPDYGTLLANDAGLLGAQSAAQQNQSMAAAQRKALLQQAVIRYGGLPAGFKDQYGDVNQETLDTAKANQNSVLANLAKNYAQSQEQFRRGLAARGALQSGDLNYGQDQLDQGYAQQQYDAANNFGNDANQALSAYTGVLQQNNSALAGSISAAEANVYSNPAYRPTPATTANYDSSLSGQYGQPVYSDGSGNLYDQNGNPFTPPAPSASPAATPFTPSGNNLYQNNAALYGWL